MKAKLIKKPFLTPREQKYCRCLVHVRTKKIKPYGICTNSVYNLKKQKRNKVISCSKNYDFESFTVKELRLYANEKKIQTRKNKKLMKKKDLLKSIKRKMNKKYSKN